MATDFENNINGLLPTKIGLSGMPAGGNATSGMYPMFTGNGLVCDMVPAPSGGGTPYTGPTITVSSIPPSNPNSYDLWVDIHT
jgi:hypothetical protein